MRSIPIFLSFAALAACDGPPTTIGNDVAPAKGGYVKRVLALPVGQQRGVVLRAIQDGGGDCQAITEFKPQPMDRGRAVWAARCEGGARWIVSIGDDGLALASGIPAGG